MVAGAGFEPATFGLWVKRLDGPFSVLMDLAGRRWFVLGWFSAPVIPHESLNCTGAKEMIAVAMGGVNRRQILTARPNPIREGSSLLDRNRGVDQDSVSLPRISVDEIGGHGRSFSPGAKSIAIAGMLGVRNTSHLRDLF